MKRKYSILISGVGGQGVLTTSRILAEAGIRSDLNVVSVETHGMAQRGGTVSVHLRMGDVNSPLVPKRKGDVILSLEPIEALRYIEYVRKDGYVVSSSRKIRPTSVNQEGVIYPPLGKLKEILSYFVDNVYFLNSEILARRAGGSLAENIVLLGALAGIVDLPFEKEILKDVISDFFPERYKKINTNAFELGYESAKE